MIPLIDMASLSRSECEHLVSWKSYCIISTTKQVLPLSALYIDTGYNVQCPFDVGITHDLMVGSKEIMNLVGDLSVRLIATPKSSVGRPILL